MALTTFSKKIDHPWPDNKSLPKTKASDWPERILNSDATINWTEYEYVALHAGDLVHRDYLLGPKYTYYHPKPEKLPTLALQGDVDGWEGPVSMKPPACLNASHDDWYAQAGPLQIVSQMFTSKWSGIVSSSNKSELIVISIP